MVKVTDQYEMTRNEALCCDVDSSEQDSVSYTYIHIQLSVQYQS